MRTRTRRTGVNRNNCTHHFDKHLDDTAFLKTFASSDVKGKVIHSVILESMCHFWEICFNGKEWSTNDKTETAGDESDGLEKFSPEILDVKSIYIKIYIYIYGCPFTLTRMKEKMQSCCISSTSTLLGCHVELRREHQAIT
jgi:hypothetical protein